MEVGQEILEKRFRVIKKLGGGAFGDIYEVQKVQTGERLAAKVEILPMNQKNIMLM
jgi:serine/threonine protein kinase